MRCGYCLALLPVTRPPEFEPPPEFCSMACETNAYAELHAEFEEYERARAAGSSLPLDPFPRTILSTPQVTR